MKLLLFLPMAAGTGLGRAGSLSLVTPGTGGGLPLNSDPPWSTRGAGEVLEGCIVDGYDTPGV